MTNDIGHRQLGILDELICRGYTAASINRLAPIGPTDRRNHHKSVVRLAQRGLVELVKHDRRTGVRITDAGRKAWYEHQPPPAFDWPPRDGSATGGAGPYRGCPQPF